jgi:hypothetical protein
VIGSHDFDGTLLYGPMIRRVEYLAISLNTHNITAVLSSNGRADAANVTTRR